jgi:tRNA (guanine-N7-)-methyltransferase
MDWASLYPAYAVKSEVQQAVMAAEDSDPKTTEEQRKVKAISKNVEVADIGCGFGGLLFALAPKFPDTLIVGGSTSSPTHLQLQSKPH